MTPRNPDHARRLGIRIIHQELALVPELTVAENIVAGDRAAPPRSCFSIAAGCDGRAREILDRAGSRPLRRQEGRDARHRPAADRRDREGAGVAGEDPHPRRADRCSRAPGRRAAIRVLRRFRERGRDGALRLASRSTSSSDLRRRHVLRDGRVVDTVPIGATTKAEIIRLMIGRPLSEVFPARSSGAGGRIRVLEVAAVSGDVLRDVSFTARAGRILGIVGLEGSGIREIGKILVGDLPPRAGSVAVNGKPIELTSPKAALVGRHRLPQPRPTARRASSRSCSSATTSPSARSTIARGSG